MNVVYSIQHTAYSIQHTAYSIQHSVDIQGATLFEAFGFL